LKKCSQGQYTGQMLKTTIGEDDKVINYVNYHNDSDVKIIKAGRLRSARNVERMNESDLCKISCL
jgi:hypothetical protein